MNMPEEQPVDSKAITKAKRHRGLLEWIVDRDGHEFLVDIERSYFKDKFNMVGLKEQMMSELYMANDYETDKRFKLILRHLY